jgi:hypothetical protein
VIRERDERVDAAFAALDAVPTEWLASGEFRIIARAAPGRTGQVEVEIVYLDDDA